MREILFRGKRIDNGEWVIGNYIKATHHWHNNGIHEDWIATDTIQNGGWCNVRGKHAVVPETIGQYTGMRDKNGKKIFEGDIVICTIVGIREAVKHKGVVEYLEDSFGVNIKGIVPAQKCLAFSMKNGEVKVIGNIHDNPELLKGGAE